MKKCFDRTARLAHTKDFQHTFKCGTTFKAFYLKTYVSLNSYSYNRIGIITAKKVITLATQRHQWKRIIRESFRLNRERFKSTDIIIMIKKPPNSKQELWSLLALLWEKLDDWSHSLKKI